MTNCDDIQVRLSEFADGDLAAADRAAVNAHLSSCAACRDLLRDLQHIRRAAESLGPIAPPDHVWLQVAGQVRLERPTADLPPTRVGRTPAMRQWIGLAAALLIVTVGAHFFLTSVPVDNGAGDAGNAAETSSVKRIADELTLAMQHYDNAVTELEALAEANSDVLDPQMTEALRQNIQTVNAAIEESRAALVDNPGSKTAHASLIEALRRKVVVLQATVNLMNEMRKGNQTGAVAAAAVFGKKS
jgi:hypothetical protein